ncbi:MAG: metallopeptidase family protein [Jatrophihabitans sp.]|nr:MAG: metallopeptidase family protein [Jatrophihabitans sp.]
MARTRRPPRRRDRRGRGPRGPLAPPGVPLARTRSESFDDLVLDAVEELEESWAPELSGVDFAVEDVPPPLPPAGEFDRDVVVDRGVPLGRLERAVTPQGPVVVLYRRPIEARALDTDDRGDLVFMVVAELVAQFLGRDIDDIDPG